MAGKDYADQIDKWIYEKFGYGKFIIYFKAKHLAEELNMKPGQISNGLRILHGQKKPYEFGKWKSKSLHARSWVVIHPIIVVGKFLAAFSDSNSKMRREY